MEKRILTLHLRRDWWQMVRDGVKTEEYRRVTPYWERRLVGREYDEIHLLCGYPKAGDSYHCIRRKWNGYKYKLIQHPEFGNGQVQVFAIDVSEEA